VVVVAVSMPDEVVVFVVAVVSVVAESLLSLPQDTMVIANPAITATLKNCFFIALHFCFLSSTKMRPERCARKAAGYRQQTIGRAC